MAGQPRRRSPRASARAAAESHATRAPVGLLPQSSSRAHPPTQIIRGGRTPCHSSPVRFRASNERSAIGETPARQRPASHHGPSPLQKSDRTDPQKPDIGDGPTTTRRAVRCPAVLVSPPSLASRIPSRPVDLDHRGRLRISSNGHNRAVTIERSQSSGHSRAVTVERSQSSGHSRAARPGTGAPGGGMVPSLDHARARSPIRSMHGGDAPPGRHVRLRGERERLHHVAGASGR
jgi:hypothetical protein